MGEARPRRAGTLLAGMAIGLAAPIAVRWLAGRALERLVEETPGNARTPSQIPAKGWRRILARAMKKFSDDQIAAVAAGATFFALLALFPAIGAFVALYGLFANVDDARGQIVALGGLLPSGAVSVIGDQMTRVAGARHGPLGLTFLVGLIVSLWSSNAGMKAIIAGLNAAYEEREDRKFIALNAISLAFTLGAMVFAIAAIIAVVAAPATLHGLGLRGLAAASFLRWPALLVAVTALFSLLYRYGPAGERVGWRWITPGGAVAAISWMVMSLLFSGYVANFGHYDRTYGSLGAMIGFMTWIWLSLMVCLFGAELNSEIEGQTQTDAG